MTVVSKEHIAKTPGICGGKACIAGHRIRVMDIVVSRTGRLVRLLKRLLRAVSENH